MAVRAVTFRMPASALLALRSGSVAFGLGPSNRAIDIDSILEEAGCGFGRI